MLDAQGPDKPDGETNGAIEILPPLAAALADAVIAVQRLARAHIVPEALLAALDGPLGGAIATAADYAGSALSETTKRAYRRDWFHFAAWCRQQAVDPATLPLHPVLVAAYLARLAGTLGRSALNGRLAAIADEHRRRGLAWNASHRAIRETLQGVGRKHGKPVPPAAALTSVEIKRLLGKLPKRPSRAARPGAVPGWLRRRTAPLRAGGDRPRPPAFRGRPRHPPHPRSKHNQEGKGADVTLPRMRNGMGEVSETCPVQALERWLARARIRRGAVFRSITAGGKLGDRLSTDGVRHILLSRAKLAKLDRACQRAAVAAWAAGGLHHRGRIDFIRCLPAVRAADPLREMKARSAVASSFAAVLELTKLGETLRLPNETGHINPAHTR